MSLTDKCRKTFQFKEDQNVEGKMCWGGRESHFLPCSSSSHPTDSVKPFISLDNKKQIEWKVEIFKAVSWSPEAKLPQLHPTTRTPPWNLLRMSFLFQNVKTRRKGK